MPVRAVLTPALRQKLGLPKVQTRPYPWLLVVLLLVLSAGPLWMAGYPRLMALLTVLGLVVVPLVHWLESHDRLARERLYYEGREGFASVVEVEPAGDRRNDHRVRLEMRVDGKTVRATVVGCPLARQGLGPGDEVRVAYNERDPRRCLVLGRGRRAIIDAVFPDEPPASDDGAVNDTHLLN